jgi:hypothetical protein
VFSVHDEHNEEFEDVHIAEGTTDVTPIVCSRVIRVGGPMDHHPVGTARSRCDRGRVRRVLSDSGPGHRHGSRTLTNSRQVVGYGAGGTAAAVDVGEIVGAG